MADGLPKFSHPPVVETVLGVQFDLLPALTTAHLGWYWSSLLGDKEWPTVTEQPRLLDLPERYDDVNWSPGIIIQSGFSHQGRFQIIGTDQERMIQVQNSRFAYNWRRKENEYPSFDKILPEFMAHQSTFSKFCAGAIHTVPLIKFWELTYVNHIFRGELWKTAADWPSILPGLFLPHTSEEAPTFETLNGEWHFRMRSNRGRLRVSFTHARIDNDESKEALIIQLAARGTVGPENGYLATDGFALGHAAIVKTFTNITSDRAHKVWGRER